MKSNFILKLSASIKALSYLSMDDSKENINSFLEILKNEAIDGNLSDNLAEVVRNLSSMPSNINAEDYYEREDHIVDLLDNAGGIWETKTGDYKESVGFALVEQYLKKEHLGPRIIEHIASMKSAPPSDFWSQEIKESLLMKVAKDKKRNYAYADFKFKGLVYDYGDMVETPYRNIGGSNNANIVKIFDSLFGDEIEDLTKFALTNKSDFADETFECIEIGIKGAVERFIFGGVKGYKINTILNEKDKRLIFEERFNSEGFNDPKVFKKSLSKIKIYEFPDFVINFHDIFVGGTNSNENFIKKEIIQCMMDVAFNLRSKRAMELLCDFPNKPDETSSGFKISEIVRRNPDERGRGNKYELSKFPELSVEEIMKMDDGSATSIYQILYVKDRMGSDLMDVELPKRLLNEGFVQNDLVRRVLSILMSRQNKDIDSLLREDGFLDNWTRLIAKCGRPREVADWLSGIMDSHRIDEKVKVFARKAVAKEASVVLSRDDIRKLGGVDKLIHEVLLQSDWDQSVDLKVKASKENRF